MSVRELVIHPSEILSTPARVLTDEEFANGFARTVAADLLETMEHVDGRNGLRCLGLAAPQIGYPVAMFRLAQWPGVFANPEIEYVLGAPIIGRESCLSLPGFAAMVGRAAKIKLRYRTVEGEQRATKMRDADARAAQHEFDHLHGVLIVNRMEKNQPVAI